jgi:soluble lytic murein transglycosylase-like protein
MGTDKRRKGDLYYKRRKREERTVIMVLITIVLLIFGIGAAFGYIMCKAVTPATVTAAEDIRPPEALYMAESSDTESNIKNLIFEADGRRLDAELQAVMVDMCDKYNVPFALALAVAEQESRFDPDVISVTNDYGIMQINRINFNWLREKGIEPLEPDGNIEAGVLILSEAVNRHGDYGLALMAYNCGDAGAKRLWQTGIYSSDYSRNTMARFYKWDEYIRGV